MSAFALDSRLAADTIALGDMPLCRLLLMDDARFPWLILVPRRPDLADLTDLEPADRTILMEEVAAASRALAERPGVDKINVGALGNIVRQLHVHIVARAIGDAAWPGPVWGFGERKPYEAVAAQAISRDFARRLLDNSTD